MKVKLTAEQIKKVQEHMKQAVHMDASSREQFIAETIGDVYDVELPIPEVLEAIADVQRAEVGEHVYYLVPATIVKELHTLTSDCIVTQTRVTPNTRAELQFTDLISEEYYVCIQDWLKGDHDVLEFYADAIMEAMNRQEIYALIQLLNAGAATTGNEFTLSTGATTFDFPKLVEMARSVAKYGRQLVLITGANVTTDIFLMDYNADKFREYGLERLNVKQIPIEELSVTIDDSASTVIDPDVAFLVAVSDAKSRKPVLFARRKLEAIGDAADTTIVAKERAIMDTGNMMNVGSNRKFSRGKAGFEEYGMVLLNPLTIAKFTKE